MGTKQDMILKERVERLTNEIRGLREERAALRKKKRTFRKSLRETEELLDLVPGALVLIQEGKIILANQAAREQLGYEEEGLLGRDFGELLQPDSTEQMTDLKRGRILARTLKDHYEVYLVTREGERLCYDLRVRKTRYRGRKAFLVNMFRVDQRKQEEMRLRRAQKTDSLVRMASGLNRELKGLLTALGDSATLFNGSPTKDKKEVPFAKRLEAAWERASLVSTQLGSITKTKNEPSEISRFDMSKLIQDVVSLNRPKLSRTAEAGDGKIKIHTYLRSLLPVEGNPQEIGDAVLAIILNAVDALPDGGEIYLTTEEHSGFVHLYIQDNGIGIKEDIKEKIFDPFFTTKDGSSRGLGLSLAFGIVTRHGGDIEVISREGQGATFIVRLPIAQPSPEYKGIKAGIKNSRVLIISDQGVLQDLLLKSFLNKGARVAVATTPREGLKLLRRDKFDLLIGDLGMRHLQPSRIIPKIRQLDHDLSVALVHPEKERGAVEALKRLGADLVVSRPIQMDTIFSFFANALATKGHP
ncbi:MAG: ATP-binding protein [Pseudomonadota bacterium]